MILVMTVTSESEGIRDSASSMTGNPASHQSYVGERNESKRSTTCLKEGEARSERTVTMLDAQDIGSPYLTRKTKVRSRNSGNVAVIGSAKKLSPVG